METKAAKMKPEIRHENKFRALNLQATVFENKKTVSLYFRASGNYLPKFFDLETLL